MAFTAPATDAASNNTGFTAPQADAGFVAPANDHAGFIAPAAEATPAPVGQTPAPQVQPSQSIASDAWDFIKGAASTTNLIGGAISKKILEMRGYSPDEASSIVKQSLGISVLPTDIKNQVEKHGFDFKAMADGVGDLIKTHPFKAVGMLADPTNWIGLGAASKVVEAAKLASTPAKITAHAGADAATMAAMGAGQKALSNVIDNKPASKGVVKAAAENAAVAGALSGAARAIEPVAKAVSSIPEKVKQVIPDTAAAPEYKAAMDTFQPTESPTPQYQPMTQQEMFNQLDLFPSDPPKIPTAEVEAANPPVESPNQLQLDLRGGMYQPSLFQDEAAFLRQGSPDPTPMDVQKGSIPADEIPNGINDTVRPTPSPINKKALAAVTVPAIAAYFATDNPEHKAWIADAGAIGAALVIGKSFRNYLRDTIDPNGLAQHKAASSILSQMDANIRINDRSIASDIKSLKELLPKTVDRSRVALALDNSKLYDQLSAPEQQAADVIRGKLKDVLDAADNAGVLDKAGFSEEFINNYLPRIVDFGDTSTLVDKLTNVMKGAGKSRHTLQRKYFMLKDLYDAGHKLRSLDIADIYAEYMRSMMSTIYRKQAAVALRALRINGKGVVFRTLKEAEKAGVDVVKYENKPFARAIGVPKTLGDSAFVTRDVLPTLHMAYDQFNPGNVVKALQVLNFIAKRSLVQLSLFHANALVESAIYSGLYNVASRSALGLAAGAAVGAATGTGAIPAAMGMSIGGLAGMSRASALRDVVEQVRNGEAGDAVDQALKDGLILGTYEDVAAGTDNFYKAMDDLSVLYNQKMPRLLGGKGNRSIVRGLTEFNKKLDDFMWGRLMTGGKLMTYMNQVEKGLNAARKLREAGKMAPTDAEVRQNAARFTNDAFGGQNWSSLVDNLDSVFMRHAAATMLNPKSRGWLQLALFAPDWTISNLRIMGKAFQLKDPIMRAAYQQYAIRATGYMLLTGSILEQIATGHNPITDSKDFKDFLKNAKRLFLDGVDLGDGRRMTISKQASEPFKWASDPTHEMVNKLGVLPKQALEQFFGKQYLTVHGRSGLIGPDMFPKNSPAGVEATKRLEHLAGMIFPIWAQAAKPTKTESAAQAAEASASSFFGHPILQAKGKK